MTRFMLVFDLDITLLERCHGISQYDAHICVQQVMSKHRFKHLQGTAYLSEAGVTQAQGTLAIQELAIRYPWIEKAASDIWLYRLSDGVDAQFIIDDVAKARSEFDEWRSALRQELQDAGLSAERVNKLFERQAFSLALRAPC